MCSWLWSLETPPLTSTNTLLYGNTHRYRLGDGGGGSTESSSKRTRSKRLSATPIHPTPLPKTGNLRGDNTEGKKQQQGQITSSPELSSHIRNVSAGAAPDSSKRAGSRHANKAIEVGPMSGGSSTFQGYERGVGGGEARAKSVSQGEEEAVGEAAVRLFPGVGSFPKLPGFSLPMVEDVDRVSILGGLGQGVNSKGRALEACDEEALSSGGTGHEGLDEALEGSVDGDLGRGGGLNGVEEPDTVSKRMERCNKLVWVGS